MTDTRGVSLMDHGDLTPWLVTISDRGATVTLELRAEDEAAARREALEWHPLGHVVAVEAS